MAAPMRNFCLGTAMECKNMTTDRRMNRIFLHQSLKYFPLSLHLQRSYHNMIKVRRDLN